MAEQTHVKAKMLENESLERYTSWRVGGKADRLYVPTGVDDLIEMLAEADATLPIYFIGLGSNLLVRDGGMNAGCYGGETWDIVHQVLTVDRKGVTHVRNASEFIASYRAVAMPMPEEWFLGAWFTLPAGDSETSNQKIKALLAKRLASQPLNYPSGGSTFRNPEGDYAARLIEASGLKGHQIGGAQVSEKHANFIVNVGECKALDIELLIRHMKEEVLAKQGVDLQQEVKVIGEYA